jgi:beta-lactam-binding protein with PASTA domain
MRRLLLLAAVVGTLGGTATLTYAAGAKLTTAHAAPPVTHPQARATVTVPDLRHQAFVFAKGQLQDAGFAWKVRGRVHGYPANLVVGQSPAPGTKLVATGAPLVVLTLASNPAYRPVGDPEDASPYDPTAVRRAP